MNEWWAGLELRERRLVLAGGVLVALMLFYGLVLDPVLAGLDRREQAVAQQRETLAWMQQAAGEVQQLQRKRPQSANLGGRSLLGVVDGSARQAGLGNAMKRVKPDGKSGVRVWFEGVSFDNLVGWLATLSEQQVLVRSMSLERPGEPGRVNAQLTLEVAG